MKNIQEKEPSIVRIYGIHQMLQWGALGLQLPIIALFLLDKGLSLFQLGTTTAASSICVILLEIPTGGLADTFGRKRLYLVAIGVKVLSLVSLFFAQGYMGFLLAFMFFGISRALISGSLDAWFVENYTSLAPHKDLQKPLAKIEIWILAGLCTGSLAAGFLPDALGVTLQQSFPVVFTSIYTINIAASFFLILVLLVYTVFLIHEPVGSKKPSHNTSSSISEPHLELEPQMMAEPVLPDENQSLFSVLSSGLRYGFTHKAVKIILITTIFFGIGLSGLEGFWQPRVQEIMQGQAPSWVFGGLSTGYFFAAALGSLIVLALPTFSGSQRRLYLFFMRVIIAITYTLMAQQQSIAGFTAFYWITFLCNGLTSSPEQALLHEVIPSDRRSTILSLNSFTLQIGGAIGSLVMGLLANSFSIQTAWLFGAGLLLLSAFWYLRLPGNHSK